MFGLRLRSGVKPAILVQKLPPLTLGLKFCSDKNDPPPVKWSDLMHVFGIKEDCNGQETAQA